MEEKGRNRMEENRMEENRMEENRMEENRAGEIRTDGDPASYLYYSDGGGYMTPPWYRVPDEDKPEISMEKVAHMPEHEKLKYGEEHGCHTAEVREKFPPFREGVACSYMMSGSDRVLDPIALKDRAIGIGVWTNAAEDAEDDEAGRRAAAMRDRERGYSFDGFGFALLTFGQFDAYFEVERLITA